MEAAHLVGVSFEGLAPKEFNAPGSFQSTQRLSDASSWTASSLIATDISHFPVLLLRVFGKEVRVRVAAAVPFESSRKLSSVLCEVTADCCHHVTPVDAAFSRSDAKGDLMCSDRQTAASCSPAAGTLQSSAPCGYTFPFCRCAPRFVVFCKGADSAVSSLLASKSHSVPPEDGTCFKRNATSGWVKLRKNALREGRQAEEAVTNADTAQCHDMFLRLGLRTLFLAKRILSQDQFRVLEALSRDALIAPDKQKLQRSACTLSVSVYSTELMLKRLRGFEPF